MIFGITETFFLTELMRKKSFLRISRTILGQVVKKILLK